MHQTRRSKRRTVAEINVVPYIDVMLVLLIIFMATAPVIMQGVKVDLPQTQAKPLSEDSDPPVIAQVDENGHYSLTLGADEEKDMADLVQLASVVSDYHKAHPTAPVVVAGAKKAQYDLIVQLMAALKDAGIENVGLMTDSVDKK